MLVGVVEDERTLRRLLEEALLMAGHEPMSVTNGAEARRAFGTDSGIEALLVDVKLPDGDGRDVCRTLRAAGQHAPVLFLTGLTATHERLAAFSAGGDDFMTKPFDLGELLARVDALGRRGAPALSLVPGLVLDPASHAVHTAAGQALLTPTEFRVLAAITTARDRVVGRGAVISAGWPDRDGVADNTLDSFIRRIREKLELVAAPVLIETVRGVGFRLERAAA